MNDQAWGEGYGSLLIAFPPTDMTEEQQAARGDLYRGDLDELTDEEFLRACAQARRACTFFPRISELLRYGRPPALARTEAVGAFDAILDTFSRPMGRPIPSAAEIGVRWGERARQAFVAAGAHMSFGECGSEETAKWVRKSFVEAWEAYEDPGPDRERIEITDGEARKILGDV